MISSCLSVGLLSESERQSSTGEVAYKPFAKYSLVFALRNRIEEVSGMYFRSTVNDTDQRHFYLKDRIGLYPGYPKADTQRLILTESVIDAATLLQHPQIGPQYGVLVCYGTNGLTDEHFIKELSQLQELIFAFDGDEAGNNGLSKYALLLREQYPHIIITTLQLPTGEDINSISLSHTEDVFVQVFSERKDFFL